MLDKAMQERLRMKIDNPAKLYDLNILHKNLLTLKKNFTKISDKH